MQTIELPGVRVTVMKGRGMRDGRNYWRARTTSTDRRTVWTGWATREEATIAVADVVRLGRHLRPSLGAVRTVADLLTAWVAHQERREHGGQIAWRSFENYRLEARHWVAELGDLSVQALTRTHVEDVLTRWREEGAAPRSCRNAVGRLRSAVIWGADRGVCPRLDLRRLEGARVRASEYVACDYTPTVDEVLSVLDATPPGTSRDLVVLQWMTGARISEIAALKVQDWRRSDRVLVISGRDERRRLRGKVEPRRFPVDSELALELERLADGRDEGDLIVGLPLKIPDRANYTLQRGCERTGVPRFTSHGLRRRMVMDLLDVLDPRTVSELTGHSVEELLKSYVRPTIERKRTGLEAVRARRRGGKVVQFPDQSKK